MILAQNALFTVFTFVVLLGTLYPLITEATQGRQVSVGEPYFDRWALPLGLGLVFLMGVGPALPWGRQPPERAMRRLLPPLIGGVALTLPFALAGYTGPLSLLALFVCGFALLANLGEFWAPLQLRLARKEPAAPAVARTFLRTRRRFGGHIAHYGVVLAVFSLALAKGYKQEEDFALEAGQSAQFAGYTLTFQGSKEVNEAHRRSRVTDFQVDGGEVLSPRMNFYPTQREPIVTPAVRSRPVGDLYLSLLEVGPDGQSVVVRAMYHPFQVWLWVSLVVIGLGSLLAFWPEPRAKPAALPQGAVVQ
jgi:cytochrome c-type biogenesis protein CcmF